MSARNVEMSDIYGGGGGLSGLSGSGGRRPPSAPPTGGARCRVVDVTFRKRTLGLDLRYDAGGGRAVLGSSVGSLAAGDVFSAIDGESVRLETEEAFQALFFRLADGARPITLSFLRTEAGPAVDDPTYTVAGGARLTANKSGKDAAVDLGGAPLCLRGALSRERRRSVVAVRAAIGRCAAGDTFLGADGTAAIPRSDGRDVYAVVDDVLGDGASSLCFAKGAAGDALYTVALPAVAIDEEDDDLDLGASAGSSFSRQSLGNRLSGMGLPTFGDAPETAAAAWGIGVVEDGGVLRVNHVSAEGLAKEAALRLGDVVVALDGRRVRDLGVLAFADLADEAVRDALRRGRPSVALTLANDAVVPRRFLSGAAAPAPPPPPPPRHTHRHHSPPPHRGGDDDGLPRAPRRSNRASERRVSSGRWDADRDSWSGLDASERRRLAQLRRLLRAGVGAEWHQTVALDNAAGRRIGTSRRPRPVILKEHGDFAGLCVEPARAKPLVIPFDLLEAVDMPFASRGGVDDATLAASFTITYGDEAGASKQLDLATASAAVAYMLADGVELARRVALTARPPPEVLGAIPERPASVPRNDSVRASLGEAPTLPDRPRSTRAQASRRAVTTRVAPSLFLMDNDAPQRRWWQNLRRGVVVEVYFAEDTYAVKTPVGEVSITQTQFSEGQYCRCVVVRRMRSGRREGKHWYVLRYKDGPYDCDAALVSKRRALPKGTRFVGVPRDCMVLTYENQKLYLPLMLVAITAAQIGCFLLFAKNRYGSLSEIEANEPIVGSKDLYFRLTGPFPQCFDARRQYWRLLSYQIVHSGYYHLACNCIMQLVFGASVEMVHGHFNLLLVYQFGVALGALTCAFTDIHRAVVGASGGVYTLIGLHAADVLLNFRAMSDPIRRLSRAFLCTVVPAMDVLVYLFVYSSDDTSYSAHGGGLAAGFLLGLALLQPVYDTRCHTYGVRPLAALLLVAFAAFAILWEQTTYPPEYLYNGVPWRRSSYSNADEDRASCCWRLGDCADIAEHHYRYFDCEDNRHLTISIAADQEGLETRLDTCAKLVSALATALDLKQHA